MEEANAALPGVRRVLAAMRRCRTEVSALEEKLHVLDALWGEAVKRAGNPDHREYLAHHRAIVGQHREMERLAREGLLRRGIRFPVGGIEHGLVDFPTTLDGRWVYLCWREGEPEVAFWHEIDGFDRKHDERRAFGMNENAAHRVFGG